MPGPAPRSRLVLVVDDYQDGREVLVELLSFSGYRTVEARDGGEALDLLATVSPDLVILDLMMPRVSGLEVLERLSQRPKPPPTIVMSGVADTQGVVRALPFVVGVFPKGADPKKLVAVVGASLSAA